MTRTRPGSAVLGILVVALAVAFVALPRPVASVLAGGGHGDGQRLTAEVSSAFVGYWRAGRGALTPELARLVEYWRCYHVVKAVTAVAALVVLGVLAVRLWRAYARSQRWPSAVGGTAVSLLWLAALVLATANVQGSVAPFSSLLSLLPVSTAGGDLAIVVGQVEQHAAHYPAGSSGALRRIVGDLTVYHVVVAAISWTTAVAVVVLMVRWWRTGSRRGSRPIRVILTGALLLTVVFLAVLGLANTTTALDSPTAVRDFYGGRHEADDS